MTTGPLTKAEEGLAAGLAATIGCVTLLVPLALWAGAWATLYWHYPEETVVGYIAGMCMAAFVLLFEYPRWADRWLGVLLGDDD